MLHQAATVRRCKRRCTSFLFPEPPAQIILSDDLEASCPGECVICLEQLADLAEEHAYMVENRSKDMHRIGLLRLPCEHTFHAVCAASWMTLDISCPTCRSKFNNFKNCKRICLRPGTRLSTAADTADADADAVDVERPAEEALENPIAGNSGSGPEAQLVGHPQETPTVVVCL